MDPFPAPVPLQRKQYGDNWNACYCNAECNTPNGIGDSRQYHTVYNDSHTVVSLEEYTEYRDSFLKSGLPDADARGNMMSRVHMVDGHFCRCCVCGDIYFYPAPTDTKIDTWTHIPARFVSFTVRFLLTKCKACRDLDAGNPSANEMFRAIFTVMADRCWDYIAYNTECIKHFNHILSPSEVRRAIGYSGINEPRLVSGSHIFRRGFGIDYCLDIRTHGNKLLF